MTETIPVGAQPFQNAPMHANVMHINGGKPLNGRIDIKGAKNLVTKAMVASLLGTTPSVLRNVPDISDVRVVAGLLDLHGVKISHGEHLDDLVLDPRAVEQAHMAEINAYAGDSRIPILFCGPLLHRLGEALIPDLGGCKIGSRPIDYHLAVLRSFGAKVEKLPEGIRMTAPDGLHGAKIELPYPSVGATEQVLLTSTLAEGITVLKGAAVEPEIMDLVAILQKMGAVITVQADRVIRVEGVQELKGYVHRAICDRNEAASWASAALATEGDITVGGAKQEDMMAFLNVFRKVGGGFEVMEDGIRFYQADSELHSVAIETDVHPGFMTDWQQPLVVALTKAHGMSVVHETVYENRFKFTEALVQMGANIQLYRECLGSVHCRFGERNFFHSAVIAGPTGLHGADIVVPDLRGGFSHVVAALSAQGHSTVRNVGIISRGYERFTEKLDALGADFDDDAAEVRA
jgi:UDP-N-acetylglucosamine 1-carboxyvinyltransferase